MKKRFKIFSIMLAVTLVFSMFGGSVSEVNNVSIKNAVAKSRTRIKLKKNPKWLKLKWKKYGIGYVGFNKKSKPFEKYITIAESGRARFDYDGTDEEIHLPSGPFIWGNFAPGCSLNNTVKRLYIYSECCFDSQLAYAGTAFGQYFLKVDGDTNRYISLYQLQALEEIIIVRKYINPCIENYRVSDNLTDTRGTQLYIEMIRLDRPVWSRDERIVFK